MNLIPVFGEDTYKRGFEYFNSQKVVALEVSKSDDKLINIITSKCSGKNQKVYNQTIHIVNLNNRIGSMSCDCPFSKFQGRNCKHCCASILKYRDQSSTNNNIMMENYINVMKREIAGVNSKITDLSTRLNTESQPPRPRLSGFRPNGYVKSRRWLTKSPQKENRIPVRIEKMRSKPSKSSPNKSSKKMNMKSGNISKSSKKKKKKKKRRDGRPIPQKVSRNFKFVPRNGRRSTTFRKRRKKKSKVKLGRLKLTIL